MPCDVLGLRLLQRFDSVPRRQDIGAKPKTGTMAMRSAAYRSRSTGYASKRPTLARICRAVKKSLLA